MNRKRLLLLTIALLLIGAVGYVALRPGPVPPGLAAVGAQYDAEILRDTWGVPHIFGRTDADAAYGLAFAHAEDDFATIQGALLAARGRLASAFGRSAAPNDYMVHLLRVQDVVAAGYGTLSPAVQAICQAYADGLNHYAALHPDAALRGLYPATGHDVVAGFVHKLPLFFGIDAVLTDLFDEGRRPDTAAVVAALPAGGTTRGSNAIAVAPRRTADGSTFLAVNSHQPWTGPVAWYEAHVRSEEGWDMVGGTFPGAPLILHGHNRRLGWAHTVNRPDLIDVYRLTINPDDPDQYWYDGEWHALEVRKAPIKVKLWGPLSWTFRREVLWSAHGPAVRQPHGTYAIRFAGFGEVRQVEQWFRMNKAATFEAWQEAMRIHALPMFNTVYADADGNIHYHYNAHLPIRDEGYDWQRDLPGDDPAAVWTDVIPYDLLPHVTNPSSGVVQSCNNTPFHTTPGDENPHPAAYSPTLGIETNMTNRALRALDLYGNDASITWEAFVAYKYDTAYAAGSRMAAFVEQVLAAPLPDDPGLRAAQDHLRAWNLDAGADNRHAALPVLAFEPFIQYGFGEGAPTDSLLAHLRTAAASLTDTFGRLDVPWQDVNRLRRGTVDLGMGGGPDVLHAVYGTPTDDGRLAGWAGDCYILMVAWDADGQVRSESIHQFGSATSDPTAPHYADQAPLFVARRLKPVWFDEADIRANLERAYRPGTAEDLPPKP